MTTLTVYRPEVINMGKKPLFTYKSGDHLYMRPSEFLLSLADFLNAAPIILTREQFKLLRGRVPGKYCRNVRLSACRWPAARACFCSMSRWLISICDSKIGLLEELKSLQQRLNLTTVYITHDCAEAEALTPRIVMMEAGRIITLGAN